MPKLGNACVPHALSATLHKVPVREGDIREATGSYVVITDKSLKAKPVFTVFRHVCVCVRTLS